MFKLVIVYTNNSTETRYFDSWKDADWHAHMGGDHVSEYTITEVNNNGL